LYTTAIQETGKQVCYYKLHVQTYATQCCSVF